MTKSITVDPETYRVLETISMQTDKPIGTVIRRMIGLESEKRASREAAMSRLPYDATPAGPIGTTGPRNGFSIYMTYKGRRFDGVYEPGFQTIDVTSEPWHGKRFQTPSGAAMAIIRRVNPDRSNAQTNGWKRWKLAANGRTLHAQFREGR